MNLSWIIIILLLQIIIIITFTSSSRVEYPCKAPPHLSSSYPFCNPSLPIKTRAHSLVSLLTLPEKIQQLSDNASSIPRLGIPSYEWWSELLHGLAINGPGVNFNGTVKSATGFPQVLNSAASFNKTLWFLIGSALAVEARAMYNYGQAGLTFWAPNINVFRDPRWGRGQETPGEDPMVVGEYAVQFVKGFQGGAPAAGGKRLLMEESVDDDDGDMLMVSACCKHFTAYDLESWKNYSRYSFNAVVSKQDMEDTYQPPFRSCIEQGKASCLMCSYNAVNGIPACANGELLQMARNEWGFKGYITSDCDAVGTIVEYQNYTNSPEDAISDVLKAGTDINCGTYMIRNTQSAVDMGKVKEEEIDRALINLFSVQLRLGLFDGDPAKGKFGKLGPSDVCSAGHKKLALEAARQGIVLLKNQERFLPLNENAVSSLAIIGPLANQASPLGGDYTGIPCHSETLFDGLQAYIKETSYAVGCTDVSCYSDDLFEEAVQTAKQAEFVIIVAGIDLSQETEDRDRVSLLLPGKQMELVSCVAAASKRPVILVLTGGGPLDVSFAKKDPRIASILWIGYPGEAGPKALAEIIFGNVNPGGRLPMTWYPESFTNVPMNDMNMRAKPSQGYPGRTYRFYIGKRVYGFGHGMSYTNFTYKFLSAPNKLSISSASLTGGYNKRILNQKVDYIHINEETPCSSLAFPVKISVDNVGYMDGSHIVMLFSRVRKTFEGAPQVQLIGFDRVHTLARKSTETSILVDPCKDLSFADEAGERILPLGDHVLTLGEMEHFVSIETY
ncbi:hypothetical protein ACFE04_018827 [Oxalis oulophora]